MSINLTVNDVS